MTGANFEAAMPTILLHEGGNSENRHDPGGVTNFGISLRFLLKTGDIDKDGWPDGDINHDGDIDAEDIRQLSEADATKLYRQYFWDKNHYENIHDQDIATKVFDLAVNMGSYAANRVLQRAVRSAIGLRLVEDGIMGQKTFTAVNLAKPPILLAAIKSEAAGFYRAIRYKGSRFFMTGWLNRAHSDMVKPV